ncbi:retrovirus-related pol polyprotein from transposon TNT 1-94 [Tanacetum coccineum]
MQSMIHSNDNQNLDNVDYQIQEMHQEEHLDSDAETEIDDNTIPYHQYLLDTEAQNVPTEVSADTSDKISMIAILTDLQTQLDGHAKVNQDKCLEIETLKNELSQCKQEIYRLDTQKVKLDLENKVRQEQALVIQRNKRNAELVQENDLLKSTLSGKEKSIAFLQSEKEKILSEKKDLADSYLDEIVCLKNANKVARDMLQRFNMPTQTIPMLSKKPKKATNDLHKDILGTRNPGLGYMAKRAQPALYDADTLLHPTHHPVSIWDSEEVLVHQVVSMKKMNENHGACFRDPANGFYEKLNALMFVPQQELSREQAYWLPANERASQTSNPNSPVTPFTHKSRPPSQVLASLQKVNAVFPQFEGSTDGSCDQQALDTDRIQLKDTITSLRIQLDSLKVENVSLKRRYDELSKANTPLTLQRDRLVSDSGAPRHMTGDRARLINFVEKFIGTVRFGNDEYAAIVGYADTAPTPTNSSSQATNLPNTSQDVDELETQQHVQHQPAKIADNVPNDMLNENMNQLRSDGDMCMYALTVSTMEPKNVKEAMTDPALIESMQEELLQFKRLDVWVLVPPPDNIKPLTLKWLFKKSMMKKTRMEAIRIFLAYAAHKLFIVFQMDVKTAFLHGTLKEVVYMCQPEGFIDADHPSHVYKLNKALYGLKQAPKAWYDELLTFLLQESLLQRHN